MYFLVSVLEVVWRRSPQGSLHTCSQWSLHLHVRSISDVNHGPCFTRPLAVHSPGTEIRAPIRSGPIAELCLVAEPLSQTDEISSPRDSRVPVSSTTDTHASPHSCVCDAVSCVFRVSRASVSRGCDHCSPPRARQRAAACFNVYSCIERSMLPDGPLLLPVTRPPADETRPPLCSTPWPPPSSPSLRNS